MALLGLTIVGVLAVLGAFAPLLAPYDPISQVLQQRLAPPSLAHPLGVDELGRDVASRLLYGARVSMTAGVISVGIGLALGVPLGLLAGYRGGWLDGLIMRVMDTMLALPALILALAISAALGPSLQNALIAIGIAATPGIARLTRAQTLSLRHRQFVEAARSIGAGHARIMRVHILPNAAGPLVVQASLAFAGAMLAEAGLSFLGLGVQPPAPSWGSMVSTGRDYLDYAPALSFAPGGAIFLGVLGFNFIGDGIRDALDPRLRTS